MEATPRILIIYTTADDAKPFQKWLKSLKDAQGRGRIRTRLNRVEDGNLGVHKSVGDGVTELIFDFGPAYRVYIGQEGNEVILLLGGDKSTQQRDIELAKAYWRDHLA